MSSIVKIKSDDSAVCATIGNKVLQQRTATVIVNTSTASFVKTPLSFCVKPFPSKCVLYGNGCYSGVGVPRTLSSQI